MNVTLIATVFTLLCKFAWSFAMTPQIIQEKSFQSDLNYQSIHKLLQSIDNRIQNLESTINMQHTTLVDGKMEYYGRKIENMEKDVTRLETYVRIEMDKLLENINNNNYRDDITKEHTIRKIDAVYERINHKLNSIEGQMDLTNIKSQNAREIITSKLDKIEEKLHIRNSDLEAEIADTATAIDDLKTTCIHMEENLVNLTRDSMKAIFKGGEKSSKKHFSQAISIFEEAAKNITTDVIQLQQIINHTTNNSIDTYSKINKSKMELEESMNEYANKITDMYTDLWKKTDIIDNTIKNLAIITNITRNEQQNGLRALMVQVGRKTPKNVQNDSIMDNKKLTELIQKVDSNFQNIMTTQNLFLESCHRVQMDESQLESQISIVLDKLIDTFENKTVVEPKDIKRLEHLIRNHDSNIKKSIYQITSHLLNLIQKNSDHKDEIVDYVKRQLLQLDALNMMLHEALNIKGRNQNSILHEMQILQQTIKKTQESLEHTNTMNMYLTKMLNSSESRKLSNKTQLDDVLEYIANISIALADIEKTIGKSYFNIIFNKHTIEIAIYEFEKQLHEYIQEIRKSYNINSTQEKYLTKTLQETINITQIALEIFNTHIIQNKQLQNLIQNYTQNIPTNASNQSYLNFEKPINYTELNHTPKIFTLITAELNSTNDSNNYNKSTAENILEIPVLSISNSKMPNYSTDLKLSVAGNSNENTSFDLSLNLNSSNSNTILATDATTTLSDLEQLFQTTEKATALLSEEQLLITESTSAAVEHFELVDNLVSSAFEEVPDPD